MAFASGRGAFVRLLSASCPMSVVVIKWQPFPFGERVTLNDAGFWDVMAHIPTDLTHAKHAIICAFMPAGSCPNDVE